MKPEEKVPFAAEILVSDVNASLDFYQNKLNFELLRSDPDNKFAVLKLNDAILMIKQHATAEPRGSGVILRLYFRGGLKEYYEKLQSTGVTITKPMEEMDYGLERFYATDPDGYQLKFAQDT